MKPLLLAKQPFSIEAFRESIRLKTKELEEKSAALKEYAIARATAPAARVESSLRSGVGTTTTLATKKEVESKAKKIAIAVTWPLLTLHQIYAYFPMVLLCDALKKPIESTYMRSLNPLREAMGDGLEKKVYSQKLLQAQETIRTTQHKAVLLCVGACMTPLGFVAKNIARIAGQSLGLFTMISNDQELLRIRMVQSCAGLGSKIAKIIGCGVSAPLMFPLAEELVFRQILHTEVSQIVEQKLQNRCPRFVESWKGWAGKIIRSVVLGAGFTLIHGANYIFMDTAKKAELAFDHVMSIFGLSMGLGLLYESVGFWGSAGLHIAFNAATTLPLLWQDPSCPAT